MAALADRRAPEGGLVASNILMVSRTRDLLRALVDAAGFLRGGSSTMPTPTPAPRVGLFFSLALSLASSRFGSEMGRGIRDFRLLREGRGSREDWNY